MAMAACTSLQLFSGSHARASPRKNGDLTPGLVGVAAGRSRQRSCLGFGGEGRGKSGGRERRIVSAWSTADDRVELGENAEGIISGEWPENFSLLSYEDLRAYLEPQILKDQMKPSSALIDVMSTTIRTVTADQTLEEIDHHFEFVSGLPVVDDNFRCIGVVSKSDKARAVHGVTSKVSEYMSSPAITLSPDKTVMDAAVLMLKKKIHRIPVVNAETQVIGMVTRTDIFQALEAVEV